MHSITAQNETNRPRAMVFTSLITATLLLVLTLITLYTPTVAQEREETVLIDLNMAMPLMEQEQGQTGTSAKEQQNAQMHTGLSSQNMHSESRQQQQLPVDNKEALFPGMQNEENGEGKPGTTEPGTGDDERTAGVKNGTDDAGYKLSGRNCIYKPNVLANIGEEGDVTVNIWVDEKGEVTRVGINEQNTNTSSPQLRKIAKDSALKTKWSPRGGSPEQKGHIVYKFELK